MTTFLETITDRAVDNGIDPYAENRLMLIAHYHADEAYGDPQAEHIARLGRWIILSGDKFDTRVEPFSSEEVAAEVFTEMRGIMDSRDNPPSSPGR